VFEKQIRIIARRYAVTTELGRPHSCLITFDDGYLNNQEIAEPVLRRHGARAYFFVPLEIAESGEALWVDRFRLWLSAAPAGTYRIAGAPVVLDGMRSRHEAAGILWRLIEKDYGVRHAIISDMDRAVPFPALPVDPSLRALRYGAMSREALQGLARAGHRIGAHSRRHDILSRLPAAELEEDFASCAAQIDSLYNTRVYAYPFGGMMHVNDQVIAACHRAGFSGAFLYLPTLEGTGLRPGPFAMPRLTLPNTGSRFAIEAKLSGAEAMLSWLARRLVRAVRRVGRSSLLRQYAKP
jgi:peptidoglycan/xylan/chitin deacetylase (PgdA/CDA1 family)